MKLYYPMRTNKSIVDFVSQPHAYKITQAIDVFIRDGTKLIIEPHRSTSLASMAFEVLNVLGVTAISQDPTESEGTVVGNPGDAPVKFHANFSFMENENLQINMLSQDPTESQGTVVGNPGDAPSLINAEDKFLAVTDPFYQVDDKVSDSDIMVKHRSKSMQQTFLIKLASALCALNMDPKHRGSNLENKYLNDRKLRHSRRSGK